jgi:hypothetical protein
MGGPTGIGFVLEDDEELVERFGGIECINAGKAA